MRNVKLQMQMTIDGFVAGPNGEQDWMIWDWDDPLKAYVGQITEPVDCILLGRKLAQGFIPYWTDAATDPDKMVEGAQKFYSTPKVVFSKTLATAEWENATLATGDLSAEITALKNQSGGDMMVYGGANFVANLIKLNLIDEYHLFINPVALGRGMAIFGELEIQHNLTLANVQAFDCGIVVLKYQK